MTSSTEQSKDQGSGLPLDMIIFGGMGDLAMRKLLPALYMAFLHGNLPGSTRILSTGRQDIDRAAYLKHVEEHSRDFIAKAVPLLQQEVMDDMGFEWARPTSFAEPTFTVGDHCTNYAVDHSPS